MESSLYISGDAKMYGNTATTYAPGIYSGSNSLYVEGAITIEDGIYIENRNTVAKITNELPQGAVVQINSSDYVVPDEAQAPIVVAEATNTHPTLTNSDLQAFKKPTTGFENWTLELAENNTQIVLVPIVAEEYTITYLNLHGATHNNPTTYTEETPTFVLNPPSNVKCRYFIGWYDENNQIRRAIVTGTTGNIVLTARWLDIGPCKIGYVLVPKRRCCSKKCD